MELEEAIKVLKEIKEELLENMSVAEDWASLGEGYEGVTEDDEKQVEAIEVILKELDKKDKVIDEMAKSIYKDRYLKDLSDEQHLKNIRYFYFKKIENDERRNFYKKVEEQK